MMRSLLPMLCGGALGLAATPDAGPAPEKHTYKTIDSTALDLFVVRPADSKPGEKRPAIVFFHGGGWKGGTPDALLPQCRYLAERGMVAITVRYRLAPAVKVEGCVRDAVSAMRWVRQHAEKLDIDPARIAAGGGSAGGHLAAATALLEGFDEPGDDTHISSRPDALVLFNPAVILAPIEGREMKLGRADRGDAEQAGQERFGTAPEKISPYHHILKGAPPTIIMHGTADTTVPIATVELFTKKMKEAGNRCELVPYEGRPHSFFNLGKSREDFASTMADTEKFLASLGWIKPPQ
jgi:acetyl esterase